jgi:hypothetical protein
MELLLPAACGGPAGAGAAHQAAAAVGLCLALGAPIVWGCFVALLSHCCHWSVAV